MTQYPICEEQLSPEHFVEDDQPVVEYGFRERESGIVDNDVTPLLLALTDPTSHR